MKRRFIVAGIACIVLLSICGCDKYIKTKTYNTDIYGIWSAETSSVEGGLSTKQSLEILADNTYKYYISQKYKGENKEEYITGNIQVEDINRDIAKITFNDFTLKKRYDATLRLTSVFFKYKNLIGNYLKTETEQIKNRSDFLIPLDDSGKYYLRFSEDGVCRLDSFPDEEQYSYKYKVKSDIIWIDYGYGFQADYYIVEDGIFTSTGFHKTK